MRQCNMDVLCRFVLPGSDHFTDVGGEIFVSTDGVAGIIFDTGDRVDFTNVGGKIIMNRYNNSLDSPISSVTLNGDDCDEDINPTS